MEANLNVDSTYFTQEGRDITRHAPNIGVGPWWGQKFDNSITRNGNMGIADGNTRDPNNDASYAHKWKNNSADDYAVDWRVRQ